MASTFSSNHQSKLESDGQLQALAYETLSSHLQAYNDQVITLEVLPSAFQPPDGLLIHDGLFVGIPKKILALSFLEARKRFFNNIKNSDSQSLALNATKVMLLFDPEHLTAANFRKRRLVALQAVTTREGQLVYREAVKYEFCFLDTILTSPLHRQSKSPTLWHHRVWLRNHFVKTRPENLTETIDTNFWRTELTSVCSSGEQHPKNYYAWQYARRLLENIDDFGTRLEFGQQVKDWCFQHPSDISGWTCLLCVILKVEPVSKRQEMVQYVLNYAMKLRTQQESIWVFVRTVVAHESLQHGQREFTLLLGKFSKDLEAIGGPSILSERVRQTLQWIETYSRPDSKLDTSISF
ncbi:hypothetical protein GQ44DRAFT_483146 [Phaeosphaeriaceae sp. PMI808]|nr:hypothetical protein GQ44DRAFT_483146 [Phaeosphaeriaceae sp. PMI808]